MRLYPITIDVNKISDQILNWAETQGAVVDHDRETIIFPNSKLSKGSRLHFDLSQRQSALLFLLLFDNCIINHNMKELNEVKDLYDAA